MINFNGWYFPDDEQHMQYHIENFGGYQLKQRRAALKHVKNFRTAIDVGAHVGLWSRDLSNVFQKVVAFEPIEKMIECFRKNVTKSNVELLTCCLGNENREDVSMVVETDNTGKTHVDPKAKGSYIMYKLDKIAAALDIKNIDYIKIDAESFEEFVIAGAKETILKWKPVITIEQKDQGYYEGIEGYHGRYGAKQALESLGMKQLERVSDDLTMGW